MHTRIAKSAFSKSESVEGGGGVLDHDLWMTLKASVSKMKTGRIEIISVRK